MNFVTAIRRDAASRESRAPRGNLLAKTIFKVRRDSLRHVSPRPELTAAAATAAHGDGAALRPLKLTFIIIVPRAIT